MEPASALRSDSGGDASRHLPLNHYSSSRYARLMVPIKWTKIKKGNWYLLQDPYIIHDILISKNRNLDRNLYSRCSLLFDFATISPPPCFLLSSIVFQRNYNVPNSLSHPSTCCRHSPLGIGLAPTPALHNGDSVDAPYATSIKSLHES